MVHGWLGWQRIGTDTIGLDYWYQILPDMARNGSTVFAAQLSPANTTTHRGEQLIHQVDEVLAITGKEKSISSVTPMVARLASMWQRLDRSRLHPLRGLQAPIMALKWPMIFRTILLPHCF